MKISTDHACNNNLIAINELVTNNFNKLRSHPNIIIIKSKKKIISFSFGLVNYCNILKKLKTLDTASQQSDVPTKILKQNPYYFAEYFCQNINLRISKFPVYKKKSKNSKDNFRPLAILSNISKTYKRSISDQIQLFFDSLLSKYHCRVFRG